MLKDKSCATCLPTVYFFMVDAPDACDVHREGVMMVTREQFHASAIRLDKDVFISNRILHTFHIVPARFARPRFMSDFRSPTVEVFQEMNDKKRHSLKMEHL